MNQSFPTPTRRDYKDGPAPRIRNGKIQDDTLGRHVHLRNEGPGSLNPSWVELLMNWPENWTSLEPMGPAIFEDWFASTSEGPWKEGLWEKDVPRVSTGTKNRVSRLKAIGNGQVSLCAATAWRILSDNV